MGGVTRDEEYAGFSENHVDVAAAGRFVCAGSIARWNHDLQNPVCVERGAGVPLVRVCATACNIPKHRGAFLSMFLPSSLVTCTGAAGCPCLPACIRSFDLRLQIIRRFR
jgi:hypothetical protein